MCGLKILLSARMGEFHIGYVSGLVRGQFDAVKCSEFEYVPAVLHAISMWLK